MNNSSNNTHIAMDMRMDMDIHMSMERMHMDVATIIMDTTTPILMNMVMDTAITHTVMRVMIIVTHMVMATIIIIMM